MTVFKRKQIIVLSLVLMIVVAGYLQYSYKKSSSTAGNNGNGKLGEAVYVDNQEASGDSKDAKDNKGKTEKKDEKATSASRQANDFFAQARLDKDVVRSRDVDALKELSSDTNAAKEVKAEAYEKMIKIVDQSQMEAKIEGLIKGIGFEDAVALFAEDGSLDVLVKAPSLNSQETAQITDVVIRHTKLGMDKIFIKKIY